MTIIFVDLLYMGHCKKDIFFAHHQNVPPQVAYLLCECITKKFQTHDYEWYDIPGADPNEAKAGIYVGLLKLNNVSAVKKMFNKEKSKYDIHRSRIQLINQVKYIMKS